MIDIANYKDDRGKRIQVNAKQLIIANGNQFNAERILGSTLRSGTADNPFINGFQMLKRLKNLERSALASKLYTKEEYSNLKKIAKTFEAIQL